MNSQSADNYSATNDVQEIYCDKDCKIEFNGSQYRSAIYNQKNIAIYSEQQMKVYIMPITNNSDNALLNSSYLWLYYFGNLTIDSNENRMLFVTDS